MLIRIRSFMVESMRVFRLTKKPSRDEFSSIVKVSSIGIAIIGLIGFAIAIAVELL